MCLDSDLVHQGGNLGQIHRLELFIFSPKSLSLYIHSCPFSCGGTDTVTCTNYQAHTCPMPTIVYNVCVCVCVAMPPLGHYIPLSTPLAAKLGPKGGLVHVGSYHTYLCTHCIHFVCVCMYYMLFPLAFPFALNFIGE